MEEVKSALGETVKSVAKNPLMSLLLIIFLVQSYIMVIKLDNINETLVSIHKDNVATHDYIKAEMSDSAEYNATEKQVLEKLALIYENVKR